ncbi:MAG: hypothetical protein H7839_13435 [Magnetococcus sp. YQC-5]
MINTNTQTDFFEGTAKQVMNELAHIPDDTVVRLMVGRPSLSTIAHQLQNEASIQGMTDTIHDELMKSLKRDE